MHTIVKLAALLLCAALATLAMATETPAFEKFPASKAVVKHSKHLQLTTAQDQEFQSALRDAFRRSPDFADHHVLATIGCGASCVMVAALDKATGKVAWLPFTLCCWSAQTREPIEYRRDSELLVLHGQRDEKGSEGPHHYRLVDGQFVELP